MYRALFHVEPGFVLRTCALSMRSIDRRATSPQGAAGLGSLRRRRWSRARLRRGSVRRIPHRRTFAVRIYLRRVMVGVAATRTPTVERPGESRHSWRLVRWRPLRTGRAGVVSRGTHGSVPANDRAGWPRRQRLLAVERRAFDHGQPDVGRGLRHSRGTTVPTTLRSGGVRWTDSYAGAPG